MYTVTTPWPHTAWQIVFPSLDRSTAMRQYGSRRYAMRIAHQLAQYGATATVRDGDGKIVVLYKA